MTPRNINYLRHVIYAKQALGILLNCWKEDRHLPVILVTPRNKAVDIAKTIRVILAKERSKLPRDNRAHYGFTLSEPFAYTDNGVRGEAVVIRWRITAIQRLRNTFNEFDFDLQGVE